MVYCVLVCMMADDCSLLLSDIAESDVDVILSNRIFSRCNECVVPRRFLLSCLILLVDISFNGVLVGNDDRILLLLTKVMSVPMNAEVTLIRKHRPNNIMAEEPQKQRLLELLNPAHIEIASHALRRQPILDVCLSLPGPAWQHTYLWW